MNELTLKEILVNERNTARKEGKALELRTLQSLLADIEKREKAGKTPVTLTDQEVLSVLEKAKATRLETVKILKASVLAPVARIETEEAEAAFISTFLPEKKTAEEVKALVEAFIEENSLKGTGMKSMKLVMAEFSSDATIDRGLLAGFAKELLA